MVLLLLMKIMPVTVITAAAVTTVATIILQQVTVTVTVTAKATATATVTTIELVAKLVVVVACQIHHVIKRLLIHLHRQQVVLPRRITVFQPNHRIRGNY